MKILMFGAKPIEDPYIQAWANENNIDVQTTKESLTQDTVKLAKGFDGISIQQTNLIGTKDVYQKLAQFGIKQISTRTVGFDTIDLDACKENDITVTNVGVYSPRAIAEMGLTHAMYLLRHIGQFKNRMAHNDFRWAPELISNEIYTKTVGIIGLGNIGGASAQIYQALGAKVLAYDVVKNVHYAPFAEYTDLDTLLKESDIISLHTPLLPSTKNMIAAPQFKLMKNTAIFLNMARGGLVKTKDLISALENKEIAAAGLDTLDQEAFFNQKVDQSELPDDYVKLSQMDNVLITPHVAFYTQTSIKNMVEISLNDVVSILNGKRSPNEVQI